MPKSPQSVTKCVWIRPLVDSPQMKKVAKRIQKVELVDASFRMTIGEARAAFRFLVAGGGGVIVDFPDERQVDVRRPIAHQQQHDQGGDDDHAADEDHRGAPAVAFRQLRHQRQENELAGGRACREHADHEAAMLGEPACRYCSGEHHGGQAGAEADDDAPAEQQLPDLRHEQRADEPDADGDQREDDDLADAEIIHESGGEGSHQAEQQEANGKRRGDGRGAPAELVFQRLDEHAGGAHGSGGDQHGQECGADDDPSIVDVAPGKRRSKDCGDHRYCSDGGSSFSAAAGVGRDTVENACIARFLSWLERLCKVAVWEFR